MDFKQITSTDIPSLSHYFENQRYRLCPYALSSIVSWTTEQYAPYGIIENDTLIVLADFPNAPEYRHLILPISPNQSFPPGQLYKIASKFRVDKYWYVPADYVAAYPEDEISKYFIVKRQLGYDDYIYRTDALAQLKGNKFSKKRNLINQFRREYLNGHDRAELVPINTDNAQECIQFLEEWCEMHECGSDEEDILACEKEAAVNTIQNIKTYGVKGLCIRIDGKVSAFGISSYLTPDMGTLQFEKAFPNIKGLYQFLDQMCAQRLFNGFTYINKENDMQIEGLMKSKKSYYPIEMIESYELRCR